MHWRHREPGLAMEAKSGQHLHFRGRTFDGICMAMHQGQWRIRCELMRFIVDTAVRASKNHSLWRHFDWLEITNEPSNLSNY